MHDIVLHGWSPLWWLTSHTCMLSYFLNPALVVFMCDHSLLFALISPCIQTSLAFIVCSCATFYCYWWCYSLWCHCHWSLILFNEQLDVFMDRQVHRHLTNCIPSCALNNVFDSALLKAIVLVLLRDRQTHMMPEDITTLMVRIISMENQNKLEDWLATYLCDWSWRLRNFL